MFDNLHIKYVSTLAVAGTATLVSPATCWRGLFSRNCQIHLLSCKSCRNRARKNNKNMQNKAKFSRAEMNVTTSITKDYENFLTFCRRKNKAKQSQNKANLQNDKMNLSTYKTGYYENFLTFCRRKNKAKQTQFEPNFSPILALFFQFWLCNSSIFVNFSNLEKALNYCGKISERANMSLESYFNPHSVAIVGASAEKGKVGYEILTNMISAGCFLIHYLEPVIESKLKLRLLH